MFPPIHWNKRFGVNHPKLAFHKQGWFFYQRNWRANKHEYVAKYINYSYYSLRIKKWKKMAPNRTSAGVIGSVSQNPIVYHIFVPLELHKLGIRTCSYTPFCVVSRQQLQSRVETSTLIQSNIQKREICNMWGVLSITRFDFSLKSS